MYSQTVVSSGQSNPEIPLWEIGLCSTAHSYATRISGCDVSIGEKREKQVKGGETENREGIASLLGALSTKVVKHLNTKTQEK